MNEQRLAARGACFWYPAVHVAKAAASCRYRIGNLTEHLSGADVVVARRFPSSLLGRVQTVCVIRPLLEARVAHALVDLRDRGVRLVGDFDDLLFAGDVTGLPRSVGRDEATKRRHLELYARSLGMFDRLTVSTRALSQRLARIAPSTPATVVPNGLSERWIAQGRALYEMWRPGDPKVIRYFAGSPSHDRDFASIIEPLATFLQQQPAVRLEVIGPVTCDSAAFPRGRLTLRPLMPHESLPRLLATAWVNLAPLQTAEFTECKSAIKFLEAGAFHCPTLASPNDDLLRHEELGAPIRACRSPEDWHRELTALLDDERRMNLGQDVASYVNRHGTAKNSARTWFEAVARREVK